jgi:hypothetical protein
MTTKGMVMDDQLPLWLLLLPANVVQTLLMATAF